MNTSKKERVILEKIFKHPDGLLSPATLINGIADRDRKLIENLVSKGYIEEVPQEIPGGINQGQTKILNFYRISEKGLLIFDVWYKRWWDNFTKNTTIYVGIITIFSLLFSAYISYSQNLRENLDFQLRIRPILVLSSKIEWKDLDNFNFFIKNVGVLPAKISGYSFDCPPHPIIGDDGGKIILGNGEETHFTVPITNLTSNDTLPTKCTLSIKYSESSNMIKQSDTLVNVFTYYKNRTIFNEDTYIKQSENI